LDQQKRNIVNRFVEQKSSLKYCSKNATNQEILKRKQVVYVVNDDKLTKEIFQDSSNMSRSNRGMDPQLLRSAPKNGALRGGAGRGGHPEFFCLGRAGDKSRSDPQEIGSAKTWPGRPWL
jgi:hypothetical protein